MAEKSRRLQKKKKRKRKYLKWGIGIVVVFFLGISSVAFSMYHSFISNMGKTHVVLDRDQSKHRIQKVNFQKKDPFSILLLGVDGRSGENGRSDTIIILTVNPNSKDTKMLSIPRDTYTEIVGKHSFDKINHAYAFGGIKMSMDTVEKLLNIPIDYIAEVNMDGFSEMIDAIGGITVESPYAFEQNGYYFKIGKNQLDGKGALAYIRNRHDDPEGDFGRQQRQQQLISGVMKEAVSVDSLFNYQDIFNSLGNNIQTNLTFKEIMDLQKNYKDSITHIDQLHFEKGNGEIINGIWYYKMDEAELKKISTELRKHLEVS